MAVLDMAEVIDKTELLAMMIVNSEIAEKYRKSKEDMYRDEEAKSLLRDFNDKKKDYEEVQRFGRYHPDFAKVRREVFALKRKLDQHPVIARFKQAEKELEELLYEVSLTISGQISPSIKVPGTNPYFTGIGCGSGGCGTGGRCGCNQ